MMQQSMNLLLVAALTVSGVLSFSVAPFGVVPRSATRSSSLSCPPPRDSLRASPVLSSWFQWGSTEPKKEATKTSDDVAEEVVAAVATEEVPVVAAAVEEVPPAVEANGVDASASSESAPAAEEGQKQPRGPKKSPVKRDRHTVFVGNLPFDITDKELRDLFTDHAKVEFVSIPRNRETGQARGFAFVDVSNNEEVQAVIANLNDVMVGGRSLRVTESLPKDDVAKGAAPQQQPKKKFTVDEGLKKIYVGNLPFDTDREELLEFYGQWGEVKDVYVPVDPSTGEARGFAFVSMEEANADTAIAESNGLLYRGRKLAVSVPLPPGEKIQRPARQQQQSQRTKLYVGNLSFYTVADTLRELFEQYGTVYDCYMPEDPSTGGSRGFGFITMSAEDAQRAAAEADGLEVDGRQIRVNEAQAKRASNDDDE